MQEHVELEVSLEIIMAEIAESILNNSNNFSELLELSDKAYKGNREAVLDILNRKWSK